MARSGPINIPIQLSVNFYENGSLFDPFSVGPIEIYDQAVGGIALEVFSSPDSYQVGKYSVTWDVLVTSASLVPGTYYDEWTYIAQDGMPTKTQRYSFILTAPVAEVTPPTVTPPISQTVGCQTRPTWVHRLGLILVEDVGNGMGVALGWEEARPVDFNQTIHYNIYYSDTRFGVLSDPKSVTTSLTATVNIPPGNMYYFAIKAAEFDTDFDITEMVQISSNTYQYPSDQTLLNNLPESYDGYAVQVSDVSGFPSNGELLINSEIMRYSGVDVVDNEFIIDGYDRAITGTTLSAHEAGSTVSFWKGIEDGNTIIRQGVAAWHGVIPYNADEIGEYNVGADGYRAVNEDILTTDLSASDENTADFPSYDFTGYHKPSLQDLFKGECVNSYVGGEFNGARGFNFQDRNMARLDSMLQVTGEPVILLRRKWTGTRCKCIGIRKEHPRTRCGRCYGTGFDGGYDRFLNPRAISESFINTKGFILIRANPFTDDLKIEADQGLTQPSELTAWTIAYPTLKDRDFIVRFNEDGVEEFRYEILSIVRNKLFFGFSGKQEMVIKRHDKTDVIYQFDVTVP